MIQFKKLKIVSYIMTCKNLQKTVMPENVNSNEAISKKIFPLAKQDQTAICLPLNLIYPESR